MLITASEIHLEVLSTLGGPRSHGDHVRESRHV